MSTLKEELPFIPDGVPVSQIPYVSLADMSEKEDAVVLELEAPSKVDFTIEMSRSTAKSVSNITARNFVDLMKSGKKPGAAAKELGTTIKKIMDRPEAQRLVRETVEKFTMPAEVRKLWYRAKVNEGILLNEGEDGNPKLALDYLKLLGEDSEVGATLPPQVNVNVGMDPVLKELLDKNFPDDLMLLEGEEIKDGTVE